MKLVCAECGHEEVIEIISQQEAQRKKIDIAPPRCSRCSSRNVKLYD